MDFTQLNPKYIRDPKNTTQKYKLINAATKKSATKEIYSIIKELRIPIVYNTLWISKKPTNGLRAIALDAQNRKQYFYDSNWIILKKDEKYKRLLLMLKSIPKLLNRIQQDSEKLKDNQPFNIKRVIAYMIQMMEMTNLRIGNKKYFVKYKSHGLCTLKRKHISLHLKKNGRSHVVELNFIGKHKIKHHIVFQHKKLFTFLNEILKKNTNKENWVFCYQNNNNEFYRVTAQMVNNYIHQITLGKKIFTAKDIRTYNANAIFLQILQSKILQSLEQKNIEQNIRQAIQETSIYLGHSANICKQSYLMNAILALYRENPKQIQNLNLIKILKKYSR